MSLRRIGDYRLGRTLGVGSFSKVKLAEHEPTGKRVAVKILNRHKLRSMQMEDKLKREIKILKMCMHPHIIRLYEVIETSSDVYVVTEYSPGGELFDYIVERGRLSESEARRFFQQIISGVEYCHQHMIAHRDLKPENLLLDEHSNVKIADFGLSNCMRDGFFLKTSCGSPNYAAPEVISGKLYAGPEVDIWSCGVIVYALLCGTLPFDDESIPYLFRKIKGGIYILPSYLSDTSKDIISKMLVTDPLKRINIDEIRRHPWFLQDLPRYLAVPIRVGAHLETIDDNVLDQVVRSTQFQRDKIIRALRRGRRNHYTVAYHLLKDAQDELDTTLDPTLVALAVDRRECDEASASPYASSIDPRLVPPLSTHQPLQDQGQSQSQSPMMSDPALPILPSSPPPHPPHPSSPPSQPPGPRSAPPTAVQRPGPPPSATSPNTTSGPASATPSSATATATATGPSASPGSGANAGPGATGGAAVRSATPTNAVASNNRGVSSQQQQQQPLGAQDLGSRLLGERQWDVGIRCAQRNPADAMMEVYRALHVLQWRWKTPANASFQIRAMVENGGIERPVRLCLQLFKSSSGYQLDVQRIGGDLVAYFVACCDLKRELRA